MHTSKVPSLPSFANTAPIAVSTPAPQSESPKASTFQSFLKKEVTSQTKRVEPPAPPKNTKNEARVDNTDQNNNKPILNNPPPPETPSTSASTELDERTENKETSEDQAQQTAVVPPLELLNSLRELYQHRLDTDASDATAKDTSDVSSKVVFETVVDSPAPSVTEPKANLTRPVADNLTKEASRFESGFSDALSDSTEKTSELAASKIDTNLATSNNVKTHGLDRVAPSGTEPTLAKLESREDIKPIATPMVEGDPRLDTQTSTAPVISDKQLTDSIQSKTRDTNLSSTKSLVEGRMNRPSSNTDSVLNIPAQVAVSTDAQTVSETKLDLQYSMKPAPTSNVAAKISTIPAVPNPAQTDIAPASAEPEDSVTMLASQAPTSNEPVQSQKSIETSSLNMSSRVLGNEGSIAQATQNTKLKQDSNSTEVPAKIDIDIEVARKAQERLAHINDVSSEVHAPVSISVNSENRDKELQANAAATAVPTQDIRPMAEQSKKSEAASNALTPQNLGTHSQANTDANNDKSNTISQQAAQVVIPQGPPPQITGDNKTLRTDVTRRQQQQDENSEDSVAISGRSRIDTTRSAFESAPKTTVLDSKTVHQESSFSNTLAAASTYANASSSAALTAADKLGTSSTASTEFSSTLERSNDSIGHKVGTPEWNKAIGQKMIMMVAGTEQSAELNLNPPELGPLQVVISINDTQVNASFVSASSEVRDAIEAAAPRLREMMDNAGVSLTGFSVNSQASQFANQERPSAPAPTASRSNDLSQEKVSENSVKTNTRASTNSNGSIDTFV